MKVQAFTTTDANEAACIDCTTRLPGDYLRLKNRDGRPIATLCVQCGANLQLLLRDKIARLAGIA